MHLTWKGLSQYRSELMGLACLYVMLHHNFCSWPAVLEPLRKIATFGNVGVDVFLILSGISLTYAYEKSPALGRFFARRMVRLLVPYALVAVPYWIWRSCCVGDGNFWLDVTQLSLVLQGQISTWYVPAMAAFYLLFPAIHRALAQRRWVWGTIHLSRSAVAALLCILVMVLCCLANFFWQPWYDHCEIALTRLAVFIVGCFLAVPVQRDTALPRGALGASVCFLAAYVLLRRHFALPAIAIRFSYIPFALALCLCALWLLRKTDHIKAAHRLLRFFGDRSLELYLTHVLLRNVYAHYLPVDFFDLWGFVAYAMILLLAVALCALLHPLIARFSHALLSLTAASKEERL